MQTVERTFFNNNGVIVTNARFIASGQTYAMSGITSHGVHRVKPDYSMTIFIAIIGLICVAMFQMSIPVGILGILMIMLAIYIGRRAKPVYFLLLRTASGERRALQSKDQIFIESVAQALSNAIVYRG